jgi:hypothetical protein
VSERHSFSLLDAACLVAIVATAVVLFKPHGARDNAPDPPPATARPGPEVLATATHLSLAGDVLWWTTGAAVYRTVLGAGPGAETLVERAPDGYAYGDVAAPYVVVNDLARHTSWIKRLGEPARVAEGGAWIGEHDLITDGTEVYWTDGTTARGTHLAPVAAAAIAAVGGRVYLAAGRIISSLPAAVGGPARVEVTTRTEVAALAANATGLYWAETDASIHTLAEEYRVPVAGLRVTAMTHDGQRLLWSACDTRCHLAQRSETAAGYSPISTVDVGADPHDLAGDGRTTVLIGGGRLLRWTEPPPPGRVPR